MDAGEYAVGMGGGGGYGGGGLREVQGGVLEDGFGGETGHGGSF